MYPQDFDELLIENRSEFGALDAQQQVAWCVHRLEAEVNNGGFHQFFSNSSGAYAQETIAALRAIGARKTSELLERALQVCFPNGYPTDAGDYRNYVADIDDVEDEIEPLDGAFYEYVEPLADLVNAYLARGA